VVVFLTMAAHATIESQYPNFMDEAFGVDGDLAAAGLAVAVLASVPVYPIVGRWAQRVAYRIPLLVGVTIRGAAGLALWFLADVADLPAIVPLAIYGAIVVALPLTDVTGALLAATTSPIGPGGGQGGYGFALAAAAIAGALMAGWVADELGYPSLALLVAILSAVALVLGVLLPRPRVRPR
jgi:MFS family permease